ncbi:hypothetical protein Bhyg_13426 [Pseudolycoriella hygida]|uniref:Uncharacterized protein n=1 Tax=Pseudolycoriella hygida TaxID=35572 RepID=A0A9Q0MN97_9DIPT|nr:hypothetical protein Bhyg_13426 [Pseudolycoriella hygida]
MTSQSHKSNDMTKVMTRQKSSHDKSHDMTKVMTWQKKKPFEEHCFRVFEIIMPFHKTRIESQNERKKGGKTESYATIEMAVLVFGFPLVNVANNIDEELKTRTMRE